MFKKRSLQVKVVKDQDPYEGTFGRKTYQDYDKLGKTITKNVCIVIGAYIGADTLRRAAIYTLSAKV